MDNQQVKKINLYPFDSLPENIKRWLRSGDVQKIVEEIDSKFGFSGSRKKIIPFVVTWVAIGVIRPYEFVQTLINEFGLAEDVAVKLAENIKGRIFQPIHKSLRDELGIDVDRLTESGVSEQRPHRSREMKMERVPPRTVNLRGVSNPSEQVHPQTWPQAKPNVAGPKTETTNQPFHLVEEDPAGQSPQQGQAPQQRPPTDQPGQR